MKTSILVCFGAAMLFACSDDNNSTPDSPVSSGADAPAGADAPRGDAGAAKVFSVTLTKADDGMGNGEPAPCTNNPGANAMGSATVTITGDGAAATVAVTNLTYSGLSGAPTLGHIHFGTSTTPSGPIELDFGTGAALNSPINKTFVAADYTANTTGGAPADYPTFITMVKAGGNAYINIHTANCGNGEIRGELK